MITIQKITLLFMTFLISLCAVQMVLAGFSISADSQDFELDYSDLDDRDEELDFTHTIVITNDGTLSEDVELSVSSENTDYTVSLSSSADSSFTLASDDSKSVILSIQVDVTGGINEGTYSDVIDVIVDGSLSTTSQTFGLDSEVISMLELDRILFHRNGIYESRMDEDEEGDGDSDVVVQPGDTVTMYFAMDNLFDNDYREGDIDGTITIELDDSDFGEDIDEEVDFVVDAGDNIEDGGANSISIEFDIPLDSEDNEYDLDVTIEAEDENGAKYTIEWTADLEVERDEDDVRVETVTISPETLSCTRQVSATVNIRNFGADRQNNAAVSITNTALNLDLDERFSLDEGFGSDSTETAIFDFTVADSITTGTYPIVVKSFYDFTKISDQKTIDLVVTECSTTNTVSTTSVSNGDTQATVSSTTQDTTNTITTAAVTQENVIPTITGSTTSSTNSVDTVEKVYSYDDFIIGLFVTLLILIAAIVLLILVVGFKVASR